MTKDAISVIIVLLLSALIGLTIIKVIEVRMSDIAINMPKINMPKINIPPIRLPKQKIVVKLQDPDIGTGATVKGAPVDSGNKKAQVVYNSLESFRDKQTGGQPNPVEYDEYDKNQLERIINRPVPLAPDQHTMTGNKELARKQKSLIRGKGKNIVCRKKLPPTRTHFNKDLYQSKTGAIDKPRINVPKPSVDHSSRPALYPRNKPSIGEPEKNPNMTDTYYRDPKTMTPVQLIKFQDKARIEKMTIKDYQNWLLTFRDMSQRLTGFHRQNLKVLIRGGQLEPSDMPVRCPAPSGVEESYAKMMRGRVPNTPNPEFLGYQPSNYEQEIGASSRENRNLRHLDYINPDEPLKTWELTNEQVKLDTPRSFLTLPTCEK